MREPSWEVSPGALATLLNGVNATQLRMVDIFTITLPGGAVYRWSGGDEPVRLGATLWALGPVLQRTSTRMTSRLEVDTCDVAFSAPPGFTINGSSLIQYITAGGFDDAHLSLERVFSAGPGLPWQGALPIFDGGMGVVSGGRHEKRVQARSSIELLNANIPRNVYQSSCLNNVFDVHCGLSRSAFEVTGAATGATDSLQTTFSHGVSGLAADDWALGEVLMTTGANAGIRRTVSSNTTGSVTVIEQWPFAVAPGDAFTAWPGCDGLRETCIDRFSNEGRYRGAPFIPVAETVV